MSVSELFIKYYHDKMLKHISHSIELMQISLCNQMEFWRVDIITLNKCNVNFVLTQFPKIKFTQLKLV